MDVGSVPLMACPCTTKHSSSTNRHNYRCLLLTVSYTFFDIYLTALSVVGSATSYRLGGQRYEFSKGHRTSSSPKPFIPALQRTEAPLQRVSEFFPRSKAAGTWSSPSISI